MRCDRRHSEPLQHQRQARLASDHAGLFLTRWRMQFADKIVGKFPADRWNEAARPQAEGRLTVLLEKIVSSDQTG